MNELQQQLGQAIAELFELEIVPEVTPAPANIAADWSSNVALRLAGQLHRAPLEIAEQLREALVQGGLQVEVLPPGFLNFISPDEYFMAKMTAMRANFAKAISCDAYDGQTAVYEFSDPNPFKVLHVGHLYTSIVGDSLARLAEYAGARVVRANFGGDVGLHVAKTLWVLQQDDNAELDLSIEKIAQCYVEGTAAYEDSENAKRQITEMNGQIYEINRTDDHSTRLAQLYWQGRELSYQYFEQFYDKIGVHFNKYYPESSVVERGETEVRQALAAGVYEESDGAVVFRGEPYGLHTRVFINREGVPTYETKDVGLLFTKWDDWHFDESVVITGNEQKDYMQVVLKSVEQYAPELVERSTHLTHGMVRLPGDEKMGSRKGNFIKAVDVLDAVAERLQAEYDSTDPKVVLGAIKYEFLKYKMGGNIVFDIDESISMTGNSGPYLQYSGVRAKKIIEKSNLGVSGVSKSKLDFDEATEPREDGREEASPETAQNYSSLDLHERALIKKVVQYREILQTAVQEKAPHKLCNYLYELAQEFSRFYENCPVAGDEREELRAQIVASFLQVLEHGLGLLGIKIPEQM